MSRVDAQKTSSATCELSWEDRLPRNHKEVDPLRNDFIGPKKLPARSKWS